MGDFVKYFSKIKRKGIIKTVLFIVVSPLYLCISFIFKIFLKYSKIDDNMIIFSSLPDVSDNSNILYRYYRKCDKYKNHKFIWFLSKNSNINDYNETNTKFIKSESHYHHGKTLKAMYYASKAKLIYFTHSSPVSSFKIKNGQTVINLWHGCGYKSIQKQSKSYIEENPFNYALVPGNAFIEPKKEFWGCKKEQIIPIGYPRYDLLFEENHSAYRYAEKIKGNTKLIVWMPTFRKTGSNYYPEENINMNYDIPLLNSEEELLSLNELCKKSRVTILIKRHPMQVCYQSEYMNLTNIIFLDNNDLVQNNIDLYSLLKYTDGLVTDYSSVAIDYILLDKPIAFTLNDFESYSRTRGFVFQNPKEYMPGHHLYTCNDLKQFIMDISLNKDMYKVDRNNIVHKIHNKCDNYCKRIVDYIEKLDKEL